ncbi:DUF221-domain-containing protein [Panus rudis PR-1116 ss-1]|nr:DUF221-domain-containing protein [Panus rudis PR-1116 ss-1]
MQFILSFALGITSFLIFSYCRIHSFAAFSPHEAHAHQAFFGWILPTTRIPEYTVLQIVGLDAAVLLNFFKMGFVLFYGQQPNKPPQDTDWWDLINDANSYLTVHLLFSYIFTITALYFIHRNYKRFIRARQLFSLELVHSIPARTVMVTNLPPHLRSEKALAKCFENMDLAVESVNVCRFAEKINANDLKRLVVPHRRRPTIRPRWFGPEADALEYLEEEFEKADEAVQKRRRLGKFKASHAAFVTFEKMSSAQIAVQAVHAPTPAQCKTHLAPEARDIIKEMMPWLGQIIDANLRLQAIVQNSQATVGVISLNALPPFALEALTYIQGYPARSWIEYSLMKKYFLFLLVHVVFIFLLVSTYWQLVRDLVNSPAKIPGKRAAALQKGTARHFFVSYGTLQGIGIMPLQLLNLGVLLTRFFYRLFITRTPRDFAELNAPPMINYGVVYPQAILVLVITLTYSIIRPLIVIFGALYFGIGYVMYKYKLLFVFYKPYESQGQAWPITFVRLIWGVVIFSVFMTGIVILRKSRISSLLAPLLGGTILWSWYTYKNFTPLSKYVDLSSVCEVQRGEDTADVVRLRSGHSVTCDETLYVAPEDERADYSQPPMANWYSGVLNTGKWRYGHPALTGVLPRPWLPLKKRQRTRYSIRQPQPSQTQRPQTDADSTNGNPWQDTSAGPSSPTQQRHQSLRNRLSFDAASGVIMLLDNGNWLVEGDESDNASGQRQFDGFLDGTILVGPLQGNVLTAMAAGWLCTTVRTRYDLLNLSPFVNSDVVHSSPPWPPTPWIRSVVG